MQPGTEAYPGKESYSVDDDIKHLDSIVITPRQKRTTAAFLVAFVLLVVYGILTKQGTSYALIVMIALAVVVTLFSWTDIDTAVSLCDQGCGLSGEYVPDLHYH